jgi:hypothetical protein
LKIESKVIEFVKDLEKKEEKGEGVGTIIRMTGGGTLVEWSGRRGGP